MIRWVLMLLLLAGPVAAHSPYFTGAVDCSTGATLRILNGDGLFGPDPRALVLTDAQGRLLAFQNVAQSTVLTRRGGCAGIEVETARILRPLSDTLTAGPVIFGDTDAAREARWHHEPHRGQDAFGFQTASATMTQYLFAVVSIILRPTAIVFGAAFGAGTGLTVTGLRRSFGNWPVFLGMALVTLPLFLLWGFLSWLVMLGVIAPLAEAGPLIVGALGGLSFSVWLVRRCGSTIPK